MEFNISNKSVVSDKKEVSSLSADIKPETFLHKFVVLMFRKYTDLEWETFEKWGLRVYEYTKASAAGLTLEALLERYDVVLINPFNTEALQFWNLSNLRFPREDVHVVSLVRKRCSCSEVERYKIQSQVKTLYEAENVEQFIQSLIAGTMKKPSSMWVEAGKKLIDFVLSLLPLVSKRG